MEIKQLKPAVVERDDCGQWTHPEFVEYLKKHIDDDAEQITGEQWEKLKKDLNIQTVTFWLSASVSCDDFDEIMMMENGLDLSKWQPICPDGFFLIDIYYTEEDAQAIFAREIRECEVA